MTNLNPPGRRWIYTDQLSPDSSVSKEAGYFVAPTVSDTDSVGVLLFEVTFYRDSDGTRYQTRCAYYLDIGELYTESQFRKSDGVLFAAVDAEVSRHLSENIGDPSLMLKQ